MSHLDGAIRSRSRAVAVAAVGAMCLLGGAAYATLAVFDGGDSARSPASASGTCDRVALSASSLTSRWAAARPGETICLGTADYGTFRAGAKSGTVTVKPRDGARVSMALDWTAVSNVRVEGVTVTSAEIGGATSEVTVAHSRFTGLAVIHADQMTEANIVFDDNTHADIDTCPTCFQGRVHIDGGADSGIVIKNSTFSGGNSDGIRLDGDDVRVLGNQFRDLRDEDPFHSDPIQMVGGDRALIRGNYFDNSGGNVSAYIMMADGGAGHLIENNVFAPGGYGYAVTMYSDDGSTIRHNTFVDGRCTYNLRCGIVEIGQRPDGPPSRGTVITNNVATEISVADGATTAERRANLIAQGPLEVGDLRGSPSYVGGPEPGAVNRYRLAPGSAGTGAATDGSDIGVR